jgi:hypothetical protein
MTLVAFLSFFWMPSSRYAMPVIPCMVILGWATIHSLVGQLAAWAARPERVAGAVVLVLTVLWTYHEQGDLVHARMNNPFPWRDACHDWMEMGEWIKEHAPESITMTANPCGLHFYSEEKTVQLPLAPLHRVIEVARYYGVTHLIPDSTRPSILPWIRGAIPGLYRIVKIRHLELYEIDYTRIPRSFY